MTEKEKTYLLKHSAKGFRLLLDRDSDQPIAEVGNETPPDATVIKEPRWDHWYQRKLARPWQATLLGMNIEPVGNARKALELHFPDKYQLFIDRLDIVQTLIGYEIGIFEGHVRSGDGPNKQYIALVEYYDYATRLSWSGLESMRIGLRIDTNPPKLEISERQSNNYLRMLDAIFTNEVKGYIPKKDERSPAAVLNWFKEKAIECPIAESTLRVWLNSITDLPSKLSREASIHEKP